MGYFDAHPGVLTRPKIEHAVLDFNSNAAAGNELVAAVADYRICLLGMRTMVPDDVALSLFSNPADSGTEIWGADPLPGRGGALLPISPDPEACWCKTAIGESLVGLLDAAVAVTGGLVYYLSDT